MAKLKTKTGCLTCLKRKKKCDERLPICGHCERLQLRCISRDSGHQTIAPSSQVARKQVMLIRTPSSPGLIPFEHDLEKELVLQSPFILTPLVSCMADRSFLEMNIFGRLCAQNKLVRDAMVAFSAHTQSSTHKDANKLSLHSYQSCISGLKRSLVEMVNDTSTKDAIVIAVVFLGLLESLKLGDPSNAISHFEVCRRLLQNRLAEHVGWAGTDFANVYRIVAECVVYNLATLSIFDASSIGDWGNAFDRLFLGNQPRLSPFLGGFREIYHVTFKINSLMSMRQRENSIGDEAQITDTGSALWQHLQRLEEDIGHSYPDRPDNDPSVRLYSTKMHVSVIALRIHLFKIVFPSITGSNPLIELLLATALEKLERQDIRESGNIALAWPLTILACASRTDKDFAFVVSIIRGLSEVVAPAPASRLNAASETLALFRQRLQLHCTARNRGEPGKPGERIVDQTDFLLEPKQLYNSLFIAA